MTKFFKLIACPCCGSPDAIYIIPCRWQAGYTVFCPTCYHETAEHADAGSAAWEWNKVSLKKEQADGKN